MGNFVEKFIYVEKNHIECEEKKGYKEIRKFKSTIEYKCRSCKNNVKQ